MGALHGALWNGEKDVGLGWRLLLCVRSCGGDC